MDHRMELLRSIEVSMSFLEPEDREVIVRRITKLLADYDISLRCTDIVPIDPANERILKRYIACLRIDGKSEKTIYQYRRKIEKLIEFMQKPLEEVGTYDIRLYLAIEKERGIANRSLENTRSVLSAFFGWLAEEEVIQRNPMKRIKPVKCKEEVRLPFTTVEIDALRGACKTKRDRAMIEFLLSSGVRVAECAEMEVTDIDFSEMTVHVKHGKGDKERITYINDLAALHLRKYLMSRKEQGVALFYNKNHEPIAIGGIQQRLKTLGELAGVDNVHPHRFRHTFATDLAKRGMAIQEIQVLMGHSRIDTTLGYIKTDNQKIKTSYKRYA